jgi:hypothetical protein
MLILERDEKYFNFIKKYEYCISRFLKYCNLDLDILLRLSQQELSTIIIMYVVINQKDRLMLQRDPQFQKNL